MVKKHAGASATAPVPGAAIVQVRFCGAWKQRPLARDRKKIRDNAIRWDSRKGLDRRTDVAKGIAGFTTRMPRISAFMGDVLINRS